MVYSILSIIVLNVFTEKINCYAIDMFFVEVVYDAKQNKVTEVRCFKEGNWLDKYSPNFKTEF